MAKFMVLVQIDCATIEQAEQVIGERLGFDEDLGFPYTIQQVGVVHE